MYRYGTYNSIGAHFFTIEIIVAVVSDRYLTAGVTGMLQLIFKSIIFNECVKRNFQVTDAFDGIV